MSLLDYHAGDRISLLIDPKYGGVQANPFPAMWFLLAVAIGLGILFTWWVLKMIATMLAFPGSK